MKKKWLVVTEDRNRKYLEMSTSGPSLANSFSFAFEFSSDADACAMIWTLRHFKFPRADELIVVQP